MKKLTSEVVHFFHNLGHAVVSTVDRSGCIHCACKGIVELDPAGRVFLFDLYQGHTYRNLKRNRCLSITGVDEHNFTGYCLKGTARIVQKGEVSAHTLKAWEELITRRLTRRILRNLREGIKGRSLHPEALLPDPQHLIVLEVREIVDLAPPHMHVRKKSDG